jgi:hypothetical protein
MAFTQAWSGPLVQIAIRPFSHSSDDCAEMMLFALLNGQKGVFRRDKNGDDIGKTSYYGSEEARKKLWDHTVVITKSNTTLGFLSPMRRIHSWHPTILCSAKSLQNDWELVKILQTLLSLAKFSQILAFCKW